MIVSIPCLDKMMQPPPCSKLPRSKWRKSLLILQVWRREGMNTTLLVNGNRPRSAVLVRFPPLLNRDVIFQTGTGKFADSGSTAFIS
jgi:hypothetical protein